MYLQREQRKSTREGAFCMPSQAFLIDFLEDGDGAVGVFVVDFHAHLFHDEAQGHHGAIVLNGGTHVQGDGVAVDDGHVSICGQGDGVALVLNHGGALGSVPTHLGAVGFH